MISDDRIAQMRHAIARYGSGNGWTGDTGTLSAMIHELLSERETLLRTIEANKRQWIDTTIWSEE